MGFFSNLFHKKEPPAEPAPAAKPAAPAGDKIIYAPLEGEMRILSEIEDPVFSSEALGKGCAIEPSKGEVVAPFDGTVEQVAETSHAVGLMGDNGLNFRAPAYVGTNSFGLGDTDDLHWVTNNESIFVNVIYDLNDSETAYKEARVRVGDLDDMDEDDDYLTYVYVAKPDNSDEPAELVYIIDVETTEGAGTQIRDGRASFDWFINRMGVLSVALDYDRANYMDADSDVEVTFNISANGEYVATQTLTVPGGDDTVSGAYGFFGNDVNNYMFEQGDKIDFDVVSAMPDKVYVQLKDTNGDTVVANDSMDLTMSTQAAGSYYVRPSVDVYDNLDTYSVTGVDGMTTSTTLPTAAEAVSGDATLLANAKADGDDFVTITLDMSNVEDRTFNITQKTGVFDTLFTTGHTVGGIMGNPGSNNDNLIVDPAKETGIAAGERVNFTVALSNGITATGIKGYEVTLKIGDESQTVVLTKTNASGVVSLPITADVQFDRSNITVEAIKKVTVTGTIAADNRTVTLTFSEPVKNVNDATITVTGVSAIDETYGADTISSKDLTVSGAPGSLTIA